MSFDSQTWVQDYDRAKQLFLDLRQKSNPQKAQVQFLQDSLKRLDQQLYQMQSQVSVYNVSQPEINRRKNLVQVLQHHATQLVAASNSSANSQAGRYDPPATDTSSMSKDERRANDEILRQQRLQMTGHNQMLGDIEAGVGRLMNNAKNIGEETQLHVRLLKDMDGNVDQAAAELKSEAMHAQRLRKENKNCRLYICILVLLVVIIFLLVAGVQ
mmetsp:Transcript_41056/g.72887  ORF Transcript_41056/g.72887 Transcript_41056/m.72887 type:complete len:214 (-) Transcript_41056:413-1054(-)|eukprot:CAMPEP_0206371380 /NCGR_PEP_ID=MMETSP0294-20121207/6448_1 /ASSEMBLY_ACC=CAM_ASM_000327 /TAXON_ID=39354 /ORGANISM="Heterosigma akashiwo, Strain CCMP2393" /LENGTH=213 /DNA_ID=CAMNT_0053818495 /DNA_START=174 /DNA_END=815 /DNA_ORIENTATION=+